MNLDILSRNDGNRSNLRNAAYEALMEMIRHSPKVGLNEFSRIQ